MSRQTVFNRRAGFGLAAVLALCAAVFAFVMHQREASDERIVLAPLNPDVPTEDRVGALIYRGGLDIPRMGQNVGGLSALRWDEGSGRLLALTDDARFVWMTPVEEDKRLVGVTSLDIGNLLGLSGDALSGKEQGDSESLAQKGDGPWSVGFERDHRIWVYAEGLSQPPVPSDIDPRAILGEMENNGGLEAMAMTDRGRLLCAEREATPDKANCALLQEDGRSTPFPVTPPQSVAALGAVPTDAVGLRDGGFVVLFRSYSPTDGNRAALVAYRASGERTQIATLGPPLTVDNFEGLAVREEEGRTYFYIVSDDNFSSNQRTLLMKFEWAPSDG